MPKGSQENSEVTRPVLERTNRRCRPTSAPQFHLNHYVPARRQGSRFCLIFTAHPTHCARNPPVPLSTSPWTAPSASRCSPDSRQPTCTTPLLPLSATRPAGAGMSEAWLVIGLALARAWRILVPRNDATGKHWRPPESTPNTCYFSGGGFLCARGATGAPEVIARGGASQGAPENTTAVKADPKR